MNITDNCEICGINNVIQIEIFNEFEAEKFVLSVLNENINVGNLDVNLYLKMSRKMSESIVKGFGSLVVEGDINPEHTRLLEDLITSGYTFNAAKQYQLVRQINELKKEDLAKEDVIKKGIELFNLYNVNYFNTELDSAEWQARSARNWIDFVNG